MTTAITALRSAGYDAIACTNNRVAIFDDSTQDYHIVDGADAAALAQGADYSSWCADTSSQPAIDLIPALRDAAAAAGDDDQVALCDRALSGDHGAYRNCVERL